MKILHLLLAVFVLMLFSCIKECEDSNIAPSYVVKKGKTFEVVLSGCEACGNKWDWSNEENNQHLSLKSSSEAACGGSAMTVGGRKTYKFVFEGIYTGNDSIVMKQWMPGDNSSLVSTKVAMVEVN